MNSYQPNLVKPPEDDTDWSQQPRDDDPWVDVEAIQRRLDERHRKFGGLVMQVAVFRMPWPCTQSQYEYYRKIAGEKWIKVMDKRGWTLRSKVHVSQPHNATVQVGDWYQVGLPDQREFSMRAAFSIDWKPVRVELPIKVVKK